MPNWFPFMVLLIPLLAISAGMFRRWLAHQERRLELLAQAGAAEARNAAARIERLEARVAVLDRLATDRGTLLANEIDSLRIPAPADRN
ncbi:MAG: hypothetical protein CFE37_06105 [Alphaproteobacteria bacterium PA4]|nr:MAG: hypothetical protein CFE37_06105 [Alphaproteobacteria bacterium PA4]